MNINEFHVLSINYNTQKYSECNESTVCASEKYQQM